MAGEIDKAMEEAFGAPSTEMVEVTASEVASLARRVLAKAADEQTPAIEAKDIVKRAQVLFAAVDAQRNTIEKAEGDSEPRYTVEKALVDEVRADVDKVEAKGAWGDDETRLRARFKTSEKPATEQTRQTTEKKDEPVQKTGEEVWGQTRDVNRVAKTDASGKVETDPEDWGQDPPEVRATK